MTLSRQEITKIAFQKYPRLSTTNSDYHIQNKLRNAFIHGLKYREFLEEKAIIKK